jgi:hypothetical protein
MHVVDNDSSASRMATKVEEHSQYECTGFVYLCIDLQYGSWPIHRSIQGRICVCV